MALNAVSHEAPLKLMIGDINKVAANESDSYPWRITFPSSITSSRSAAIEFSDIWLQGNVKSVENSSESIIIDDGTGDVLVTKCSRAPGDRSWIAPGVYCGVLASVVDPSKKLPEVGAYKLMHISDKKNEAECMWPLEVQELSNFVLGKVTFSLKDL